MKLLRHAAFAFVLTHAPTSFSAVVADIIFAVDTSLGNTENVHALQNSLPSLAANLSALGVDAQFTVISDNSLCAPAPLGSGSCPNDENLPLYRHVDERIGSANTLSKIVDTHDEWGASLRPEASVHMAVLSDETSQADPDGFLAELEALDASLAALHFYALAPTSGCGADSGGGGYEALATETGGHVFDLCGQSPDVIFEVSFASEVSVNAVPLPPGIWLLLSAVGVLTAFTRGAPATRMFPLGKIVR